LPLPSLPSLSFHSTDRNVAPLHVFLRHGASTQSNGSVDTWQCHCGGPYRNSRLQRQLGTIALSAVEPAPFMREPVDMVLGSIILGYLITMMIVGTITLIFRLSKNFRLVRKGCCRLRIIRLLPSPGNQAPVKT
jgi:hypothetical protein